MQGVSVRLEEGTQLGVVQQCDLIQESEPGGIESDQPTSMCAYVKTLTNTPERYQRLMKALDLPDDKLSSKEMEQLKELLCMSTDVFALDDSELGCTGLVRHVIHTGDHAPIRQ